MSGAVWSFTQGSSTSYYELTHLLCGCLIPSLSFDSSRRSMMISTKTPSSRRRSSFDQLHLQCDMVEPKEWLHHLGRRYGYSHEEQQRLDSPHQQPYSFVDSFFREPCGTGQEDEYICMQQDRLANNAHVQENLAPTVPLRNTNKTIDHSSEASVMYAPTGSCLPSSNQQVSIKIDDEVQPLWDEEEARLQHEDDPRDSHDIPRENCILQETKHHSKQRRGSKKIQKWKQRLRDKQNQRALALHQHQSNEENLDINVVNHHHHDVTTPCTLQKRQAPITKKDRIATDATQIRLPRDELPSPTTSIVIGFQRDKNVDHHPCTHRHSETKPTNVVVQAVASDEEGPTLLKPLNDGMLRSNHHLFSLLPSICDLAMTKPTRISGPTALNDLYPSSTSHSNADQNTKILTLPTVNGDDQNTITTTYISLPDPMPSPYLDENDGKTLFHVAAHSFPPVQVQVSISNDYKLYERFTLVGYHHHHHASHLLDNYRTQTITMTPPPKGIFQSYDCHSCNASTR